VGIERTLIDMSGVWIRQKVSWSNKRERCKNDELEKQRLLREGEMEWRGTTTRVKEKEQSYVEESG